MAGNELNLHCYQSMQENPPLPMSENGCEVESFDADHADGRAHGDEGKLERLLKRVRHLRLVSSFEANAGGFSCADWQAIRLHKVQKHWQESLDLALAQAERALMGMIETESQYGGCHD